ncbi:MAG: IS481 family transposase, partial [Treponema sp.]|nr:IS481 family transposase [Treponema sp.]
QYNEERTHSGKYCYGKTPMQTFMDSIPLAGEKLIGCDETDGQPA